MPAPTHPSAVLFDAADDAARLLPVCDHYCGTEPRMRKALALQAERGPVFDVTLDGEDGAPAGGEVAHAELMGALVAAPANAHGRVGARVVPSEHPAFEPMLRALLPRAGSRLAYLMIPKVQDAAQFAASAQRVDALARELGVPAPPLHALVETHAALRDVQALAAHPRIESLSFGLMDFVSAHRGAIPASAMTLAGQFSHPLVLRAKLEIAAACHAAGKVPSHCVVTEFKDSAALAGAATRAARELGYTRMWSIHPDQIAPIVRALSPTLDEADAAARILLAAQAADWGPVRDTDAQGNAQLHDRASYRLHWLTLQRAQAGGWLTEPGASAAMNAAAAAFFCTCAGAVQ